MTYRQPSPPPCVSEDFFRRVQASLQRPEVAAVLKSSGVATEVHEALNLSCALVVALGDSMETEWNSMSGVNVCPRCGDRRWSTPPASMVGKDGLRENSRMCNTCNTWWDPMPFHRDEMVQGRVEHYLGEDLSR